MVKHWSRTQAARALSTAEAEYFAVNTGAAHIPLAIVHLATIFFKQSVIMLSGPALSWLKAKSRLTVDDRLCENDSGTSITAHI